jgi:Tol biopolymer transport system component
MLIVRVLTVIAKTALAGGVLTASAAGGFLAYQHFQGDSGTAFQQERGDGPRLVISEFGDHSDAIVAIDPNDVSRSRTTIATIDHAPGYGIFATLAPDGSALAYTALPPGTAQPSTASPAQAAIVAADGTTTLLADDIDLLIPPVWSPDGKSIVVRKNTPADDDSGGTFELVRLGRDGSRATISTWHSAAVFPIAFAPDGSKLYFATLNIDGSDLYSVAPDGSAETQIAHLSDEITRGWTLSPDGAQLAYSVAVSGDQPGAVTKTLDLASGALADALSQAAGSTQFNPAWKAPGELTVGAVKPEGGGDTLNIESVGGGAGSAQPLTNNSDSMDLPLSWSPGGTALAVQSVEGKTPFEAGASHVDLIAGDGTRTRVSDSPDVLVVGWLQ